MIDKIKKWWKRKMYIACDYCGEPAEKYVHASLLPMESMGGYKGNTLCMDCFHKLNEEHQQ